MKYLFTSLFVLLLCVNVFAQSGVIKISGTVKNDENKPLSGANLVLEGTIDGATTDEKGMFEFETEKTGTYKLIITALEYAAQTQELNLEAGMNMTLDIKMKKSEVTTESILVTASSFTSGENSKVTLTPLEIVRIPGADGDLYRALTTFPGSNQVDEGSRITVRGGDPNEVVTILDQATLYNPFIFDNTFNTSSFSTVDPWSLKGINFTSGGFSAKFGNALSAVLDLKSYDMPTTTGAFVILGVGAGAISGVYNNKGKFGGSFSASQTYLKPFFDLNGITADYSKIPEAQGLGGTLSYKFGKTGYMKAYGNYSGDKIGIRNESPSYDGFFNSESKQYFGNYKISFSPTTGSSLSFGTSASLYDRKANYGVLDTRSKDYYGKARIDYVNQVTHKMDLNAGLEYEYNENKIEGVAPQYSYNIRPDAPSVNVNSAEKSGRLGAYAETQMRLTDNFFAITGLRTDYHTLSKKISFDPRLSMGYQFAKYNVVRGAVGMYHQYTAPLDYLRTIDNDLKPEDAIHYILGYEYNKEGDIIARVEAYYKDYGNLVAADPNDGYRYKSFGSGFAKGIDVFIKYKYQQKFTGWISYAYSDSKRRQYDALTQTSADYDITHNMSFTGSYNLTDAINIGATYRISTGRPYTPVTGANYVPSMNVYEPVYAEKNSDRFPTYTRLDLSFQYITAVLNRFCVMFVAFNNVLDTKNLYGYTYNFDYSQKIDIRSNNKRIVWFGIGMQL